MSGTGLPARRRLVRCEWLDYDVCHPQASQGSGAVGIEIASPNPKSRDVKALQPPTKSNC
jgi:hypothetical protein